MGVLLDSIPAVCKAVARAERNADERRDLALSGVDLRLCGLDVRQLTPRHLLILFAARNPFLFGGRRASEHVAQFLWIVRAQPASSSSSSSASPASNDREKFLRRVARIPYLRACKAIDAYIDASLMDKPPSTGSKRSAIVGTFASIVHEIASLYGWSRDTILDSPIAEIYQYFRLITRDRDPKAIFFNPADKARRLAFNKWKAAKAARAAKASPASDKGGRRG